MNMKMMLRLVALDLKVSLRGTAGRISRDRGGWRSYILFAVLGLAFLPLVASLVAAGAGVYIGFRATGQPSAALTLFMVTSQVVALVFGFFYTLSGFYFARDLRILVPLPLHPSTILGAKFLRVVISEYLTMGALFLPVMIAYGIGSGTALYWPIALLVFILLPVLPLAVDGLLVLLLMRATAGRKLRLSRDVMRVAGALFGVAIMLIFQFGAKHSASKVAGEPPMAAIADTNPLGSMLTNHGDLIVKVGSWVPPTIWATHAMAAPTTIQGLLGLAGYVGINLLLAGALFALVGRMYLRSLLVDDGGRTHKAATASEVSAGAGNIRSPFQALFWREFALLIRTPMWLLNTVLPLLIMPVAFLAPLLQEGNLGKVQAFVQHNATMATLLPAIGMGIALFVAVSGPVSSTAISREGRRFWISRMLPVDPGLQVAAKIMLGIVQSAIGVVGVAIIMLLLMHAPVGAVLEMIVGGLAASALAQSATLMIDLVRPYLTWTDPQQAVKGNLNGLLALLLTVAILVVFGGLTVVLYFFAPALIMPILILFSLGGAFGMYRWAIHLARTRYREIED